MTIDLAMNHLKLVRHSFPRIDASIGFLVALEVFMLGYLSEHIPEWEYIETRSTIAVIATLLMLGFSLGVLYRAAFPRFGGARSIIEPSDVAARSKAEFMSEYQCADEATLLADIAAQIWRESAILTMKQERLHHAFAWLVASLVPWNVAAGFVKGMTGGG